MSLAKNPDIVLTRDFILADGDAYFYRILYPRGYTLHYWNACYHWLSKSDSELTVVSFAEGDIHTQTCATEEAYQECLKETLAWWEKNYPQGKVA